MEPRSLSVEEIEQRALLSDVAMANGVLNFTADAGEYNLMSFMAIDDNTDGVRDAVSVSDSNSLTAGTGCTQVTQYQARCDDVDAIYADLGDMVDTTNWGGAGFPLPWPTPIMPPATILGGDGNDTIIGGDNADSLVGGDGDDSIEGGDGGDILLGGDGIDVLDGQSGADQIYGGEGNDAILGGEGSDYLVGGAGNDDMKGDVGEDTQNDTLYGGDGNDTISGGYGTDQLYGEGGDDHLNGGVVGGGDSSDTPDTINGGTGDDTIEGILDTDDVLVSIEHDDRV